ncbi:type VII secretion system-associated protein [Microbacterium sp. KRD172]|uniref:type VII secretion system-associated protein n=1 Tax=Microbacterium sp. KRD172 TaxID=2729727 RepID=UPI0019CF86C6|nr:type VII secretion system-associated protein [Microbacterium sp. KRD172]
MTTSKVPPITDALRAEARANPGEWVYAIDPEFAGVDRVPPEGIVGAWHANEAGELSKEFTPNPRYVPSPPARGWPAPTTKLERVLQLARAGHMTSEQLDQEFAVSEVVIFSRPEGGMFLATAKDGGRLAYAFTDAAKAAASGYTDLATIRGREYAESLPEGVRIALNPGTEVALVIDPADILKA